MLPRPDRRRLNSGHVSVLLCRLGARQLALPASQVAGVTVVRGVVAVPCRDAALLGLALHREQFAPVIDAHQRLGLTTGRPPLPWTCIAAKTAVGELLVPVDEIVGLYAAPGGVFPDGVEAFDLVQLINGDADPAS